MMSNEMDIAFSFVNNYGQTGWIGLYGLLIYCGIYYK